MAKLSLSQITNTNSLSGINANFQALVDALQSKVLYRNNPVGEPNAMSNDLDMNSHNVINAGNISAVSIIVDGKTIGEIANLEVAQAVVDAEAAAVAAAASALAASGSASTASGYVASVQASANDAAASAVAADGSKVSAAASAASAAASAASVIGSGVTSVNGFSGAVVLTKGNLSLGNVDNTADTAKPVSTAQAAAIALKADASSVSNVNNTSDVNKPVSTAQAAADEAIANRFPIRGDYYQYFSTTQAKLSRDVNGGLYVFINGKNELIPSAGVTLSSAGMAASTLYYIYVYMVGATMTLEYSTTIPVTSTTTGEPIKTGDATRTCVGMSFSSSIAGQLFQSANALYNVSWANRKNIQLDGAFSTTRNTLSATAAELDIAARIVFLHWGDEAVVGSITGQQSNNTAGSWAITSSAFNSSTVNRKNSPVVQAVSNYTNSSNLVDVCTPVRGVNYFTVVCAIANGGTGAFTCVSQVMTRG